MGRLATDIGGTFTDLVYFEEASGELKTAKSLTTPGDLTEGVFDTIASAGLAPEAIAFFVHGGTTVINAITERKGARTALLTTAGFRDVLEIARGNRPDLYNLRFEKERPFVPRLLRFEVGERLDALGNVLLPLEMRDLDAAVARCEEEQVEALAVLFLHSYVNPVHEAQAAAYLREKLPRVAVTASHEITREWREYERASTTVLNAYVQPIVERYFERLEGALAGRGIDCPLFAMQSNGGTTSFGWAKAHPVTLIESGPAAGCNGAAIAGEVCGEPSVIYLDIGGTTAKCSTIEDARPRVTTEYRLEYSRTQFGYPLRIPVVDIVEIGAGGGSIAWFDQAGLLKVGPASAGADPGPACYGRGGTEPTVTDAKLVAGVLNPENFAGGRVKLDAGRARAAMQKIADGLGTSIEAAAVAIMRTVNANMINALKLVSIQRGHDPRDFALVVGGGGGAMHGAALGRELGVKEIIVPLYPGLFSAWGMLATEPRCDLMQTALVRADEVSAREVRDRFDELTAEAERYFEDFQSNDGIALRFETSVDLRYLGQEHSVTVPVAPEAAEMDQILADFHAAHQRQYTFRLDDTPVEFVTYRLTAVANVARPRLRALNGQGRSLERAEKPPRDIDFVDDGRHTARVFDRNRLPAEAVIDGPLVIEEPTATTVVHPDQRLRVDAQGFLRITEGAERGGAPE
ncbi:MAG: hydantoinase/oxoprolinase family protein [Pseudomonadota bacterium]